MMAVPSRSAVVLSHVVERLLAVSRGVTWLLPSKVEQRRLVVTYRALCVNVAVLDDYSLGRGPDEAEHVGWIQRTGSAANLTLLREA
jgi:hypothetical protein